MTKRKWLGVALMAISYSIMLGYCVWMCGLIPTLGFTGVAGALLGCMLLGAKLLTEREP